MVIEGKISGQPYRRRFNSGDPKPTCAKCNRLISNPVQTTISPSKPYYNLIDGKLEFKRQCNQIAYSYMTTTYYIYESKSGWSVIYCSKKCRDKHNHRFNKGV
jgi:hypothetical protein